MSILSTLLDEFHAVFPRGVRGQLHWSCFLLTLKALLIPLAPAQAASLRRVIAVVFGVTLSRSAYYRFMASARLPWKALWVRLWRGTPSPLTDGRLILGVDDSINPKTGRKIFGCQTTFDHAAKPNQSSYPWAQTILLLGLLKRVHGRWACIPWAFAWYLRLATLRLGCQRLRGRAIGFETKFAQATRLLHFLAVVFPKIPILVVADSWFCNNGLWQPMRQALGPQVDLLARLRVTTALYALPPPPSGTRGRPPKYGPRLGTVKELAERLRPEARCETLQLYGRQQSVQFAERLVMLKTLKRCVRIVWVFRHAHYIALFTTDLTLSPAQIIELLWGQVENRIRVQRNQTGHRQRSDTSAHTRSRRQPPQLLPVGHRPDLDLRRQPHPSPGPTLRHGASHPVHFRRSAPCLRQGPDRGEF